MQLSRNILVGCGLSLVAAACGSAPAPSEEESGGYAQTDLTLGVVYKISRKTAGKCIDVNGAGTTDGTKIQQWTCNGSGAQTFRVDDAGGGAVKLVNPASGKCADVSYSGTSNGTKIQLWTCNGTGAQSFTVEDMGGGFSRLRNKASSKCVDVNGNSSSDGVQLQIWDCNGTDAQSWQFTSTTTTPPPTNPPPTGSPEQLCVDKINALRATIGLGALARWTENETCADSQCQSDSVSGTAHGAFGSCPNWAQNECPGWPSIASIYSGNSCLDMMWKEGPGEPYEAHGHYINMTNTSYTKVSCGFYTTPDGKVWAVQDFR
jgi:hypothetical protein